MSEIALRLDGVGRTFRQGERELRVLDGASLDMRPGEIVALVGPSGAGKSTLLQIAGLLERPDQGDVLIAGQSSARMSEAERTVTRRSSLGFVYQYHHLLPEFSAAENIMLAQMIAGKSKPVARQRAGELLEMLGIAERASHRPARLSGGEQQRVAIARAVANLPRVLLADEPTGNLDEANGAAIIDLLFGLRDRHGATLVLVTHSNELAARCDRVIRLRDGQIARDAVSEAAE